MVQLPTAARAGWGLEGWPEVGHLRLWGRDWCPQELSGGAEGRGGTRGLSRALSTRVPCGAGGRHPAPDRRIFSTIYVTTGQSQFPTLRAGDFSQTLFQPEPPLWPAWQAAMSFRSHSLGMAPAVPKLGLQRVPPSPDFALVGGKVGGSRGVGSGHPGGFPQCLPRSPRWGWEPGL